MTRQSRPQIRKGNRRRPPSEMNMDEMLQMFIATLDWAAQNADRRTKMPGWLIKIRKTLRNAETLLRPDRTGYTETDTE